MGFKCVQGLHINDELVASVVLLLGYHYLHPRAPSVHLARPVKS